MSDAAILSLSATPRRVARHRVLDTDRAHSWFRDPVARRLAGGCGRRIAQAMAFAMPWKECHVVDELLRFVARLLEGEKMAPLWVPEQHSPLRSSTALLQTCTGFGKFLSRS